MEELDPKSTLERLMELSGLGRGTVDRFKKRGRITDDTLRIFCKAAKLPYPILSARHRYEVECFQAIQLLREHKADYLQARMNDILEMADLVRRELEIRERLKQPKR